MTNAELIKALRYCISENAYDCDLCPYQSDCKSNGTGQGKMIRDAADALEAAEKRIAIVEEERDLERFAAKNYLDKIDELKAQMPKEGEWEWLSSTYDRVPREMRYWCSVCHHEEITHDDKPWKHYCPNCGARMIGEQ